MGLRESYSNTTFYCEGLLKHGTMYSTKNNSIVIQFELVDIDRTDLALEGVSAVIKEFIKEHSDGR